MDFFDYTYQIVNSYLLNIENCNNSDDKLDHIFIDDYEDFIYEIIVNELSINQNKYDLKTLINNSLKNEDYWLAFLLNEYFNKKTSHQLVKSLIKDFNLFNLSWNINYNSIYKKIIDNKIFLSQIFNKLDSNLYDKLKKKIKNDVILIC